MNFDITALTDVLFRTLDRNGNGKVERNEFSDFLKQLQAISETTESETALTQPPAGSTVTRVENSHDLKTLINETLAQTARELNLSLVSLEGARYPAVGELRQTNSRSIIYPILFHYWLNDCFITNQNDGLAILFKQHFRP